MAGKIIILLDYYYLTIYRWYENSCHSYYKYFMPNGIVGATIAMNLFTIKGLLFGHDFNSPFRLVVYPFAVYLIVMLLLDIFYRKQRTIRIIVQYNVESRKIRLKRQQIIIAYMIGSLFMMVLTIYLNHHYVMIFEKA